MHNRIIYWIIIYYRVSQVEAQRIIGHSKRQILVNGQPINYDVNYQCDYQTANAMNTVVREYVVRSVQGIAMGSDNSVLFKSDVTTEGKVKLANFFVG